MSNELTTQCNVQSKQMVFGTCRSICVWDLREAKLHHQQINGLPCPLRSPSYNSGRIQFINLKRNYHTILFNAV